MKSTLLLLVFVPACISYVMKMPRPVVRPLEIQPRFYPIRFKWVYRMGQEIPETDTKIVILVSKDGDINYRDELKNIINLLSKLRKIQSKREKSYSQKKNYLKKISRSGIFDNNDESITSQLRGRKKIFASQLQKLEDVKSGDVLDKILPNDWKRALRLTLNDLFAQSNILTMKKLMKRYYEKEKAENQRKSMPHTKFDFSDLVQ